MIAPHRLAFIAALACCAPGFASAGPPPVRKTVPPAIHVEWDVRTERTSEEVRAQTLERLRHELDHRRDRMSKGRLGDSEEMKKKKESRIATLAAAADFLEKRDDLQTLLANRSESESVDFDPAHRRLVRTVSDHRDLSPLRDAQRICAELEVANPRGTKESYYYHGDMVAHTSDAFFGTTGEGLGEEGITAEMRRTGLSLGYMEPSWQTEKSFKSKKRDGTRTEVTISGYRWPLDGGRSDGVSNAPDWKFILDDTKDGGLVSATASRDGRMIERYEYADWQEVAPGFEVRKHVTHSVFDYDSGDILSCTTRTLRSGAPARADVRWGPEEFPQANPDIALVSKPGD